MKAFLLLAWPLLPKVFGLTGHHMGRTLTTTSTKPLDRRRASLLSMAAVDGNVWDTDAGASMSATAALSESRRAFFVTSGASLVAAVLGVPTASFAEGENDVPAVAAASVDDLESTAAVVPIDLTVPKTQSVLVLGSNGLTGRECVNEALKAGRPCIASTRSGNFVGAMSSSSSEEQSLLSTAAVDVTSLDTLRQAIATTKPGAVIFAASASTKGGDSGSFDVDRDGVIKAAQACIEAGVLRFVVISSGTVTRPDSAVYKLLNFAGKGIMEAKLAGEDTVRQLYSDPAVMKQGLGYTIVRPGGLTNDVPGVASLLELNQGDSKSGRLSRSSVAELCIQCLDSADTWDTTFECYEKETAKPIKSVGLSNIFKSRDPTPFQSGRERVGDTWGSLFQGLERDPKHVLA